MNYAASPPSRTTAEMAGIREAPERAKHHRFLGLSLALVFGLLPLYRFSSGGPQWVDVPLVLVMAITLLTKRQHDSILKRLLFPLIPFVVWAITINTAYFVLYPNTYQFLIKNVEIVYIIFLVYCLFFIISKLCNDNGLSFIYLGLLLSIAICLAFKGEYEAGVRDALSFNNPNQLGYFSVLLLCYVTLLIHYNQSVLKNPFYICANLIIIVFSHYFALLSLSRGAIFSVLLIDVGLLLNSAKRMPLLIISLLATMTLVLAMLYNPIYMENKLTARQGHSFFDSSGSTEVHDRLTSQFNIMKGFHVVIGMGDVPFSHERNYWGRKSAAPEVHNIFGNVFRSYGVIGVLLFGFWMFRLIWASRILTGGLLVWSALLLYNMAHNGARFRSFWVLVALIIVMIKFKHETSDSMEKLP
jgi:hypothetical protein